MPINNFLAETTQPVAEAAEKAASLWTDFLTSHQVLDNELWRWLALLVTLLASFVIGKIVAFWLNRQGAAMGKRPGLRVLQMFMESIPGPANLLILSGGLFIASGFMNLGDESADGTKPGLLIFWVNVCRTMVVIAFGWFVYRLADVLEYYLSRLASKSDTLLDDQLVPMIRKTLRIFVVIVAVIFIAQIFDQKIGPLLAGMGLGGLAFALAAKDMLANLFGSLTLISDRPFQIGDRIKIHGHDGTVEEVGFRSTRIRLLTGHLVTLPNSVVANEPIENIGKRPYIKRVMDVTLTYDTTPEKLQLAVDIIKQMLDERRNNFPEDNPARVYFSEFNSDNLNIVVYYWFTPPDWWEYLEFNHQFNMELLERFNAENIEFAFPTQTLFLKNDN